MKQKIFTLASVLILVLFMAACNKSEVNSNEEIKGNKLTIYTTIYPLQYFTQQIGGGYVTTENIVPPGSDAHSVEVTTKND